MMSSVYVIDIATTLLYWLRTPCDLVFNQSSSIASSWSGRRVYWNYSAPEKRKNCSRVVLRRPCVSPRFEVWRRLHAIDATRVHLTMAWVVSFPNSSHFGPRRATATRRAGWRRARDPVHKSNCRGASPPLLNHGSHAIDATPARWRGGVGLTPLDWVITAASPQRNDLVKSYRVHPTHRLICAQARARTPRQITEDGRRFL